mgnify:CR=1 FL=1
MGAGTFMPVKTVHITDHEMHAEVFEITTATLTHLIEIANKKLNQFQNVRDFCISQNNDEIYFTLQSPFQEISQILSMKKLNGKDVI